jgi:putative membrane protein insertion efficiency factor
MKKIASLMIKAYQSYSATREPRCKYYPSCSNYAATAIQRYGVKGLAMAGWRVLRCNPWSAGGLDYVDYELDSADALANMRQRATSELDIKTINNNRKTKEGVR